MIESMAKGLRALSLGQENAAAKSAPGGTGIVRQAAGALNRPRPHAQILSCCLNTGGHFQRLSATPCVPTRYRHIIANTGFSPRAGAREATGGTSWKASDELI